MSTRQLIMEAINLSLHDARVSDELPQPGSDEPLGMPELDISDEVAELGGLFEKAGDYQVLMNEYPESKILTASEEKMFNIAVNMSLAGTSLTVEDFKLAVKDSLGTHISQESLSGIAKGIADAIARAIHWIIEKIKAFWKWLFGDGGKSEQKKDEELIEAIKSIPDTHLSILEMAVREIERQPSIQIVRPTTAVKDLGRGAAIEGDFLVIEDKKPGETKGEKQRIPLHQFHNCTWNEINRIFEKPPEATDIDVTHLPEHLKEYMESINKLAAPVKALTGLSKKISIYLKRSDMAVGGDQSALVKELSNNIADVAKDWAAFHQLVLPYVSGGTPSAAMEGRHASQSKPYLPDGTYLYVPNQGDDHNSMDFRHDAPWYEEHMKSLVPITISVVIPGGSHVDGQVVDKKYTLNYGGSAGRILASFEGFVKSYVDAFKNIAKAFDQVEMDRVAHNASELAMSAVRGATGIKYGTDITVDASQEPKTIRDKYEHDLFVMQYSVTRAQASIFRLLAETTKMIGQHRNLYRPLLPLARKSKTRK